MPQLANVVLADRASTPVNHTFTPRDIVDGVATVSESTGVPVGDNTLSISLRRTPAGKYKATLKLRLPIVQNATVNGVTNPVVSRISYVEVTATFEPTSTEQERKDAIGFVANALVPSQTLVNDVFTKLQNVY